MDIMNATVDDIMNANVDDLYMKRNDQQFPPYILFVITNVCNAKCTFCPQSIIAGADDFTKQHLSWEHYTKAIDEIVTNNVRLVRITSEGEPMMHPKTPQMIAYAKDKGVPKVDLTTNGTLLKGKRLKQLMDNPPDIIDVSVDAYYKETFEKYRVGLKFDELHANMDNVLEMRDPKKTKVVVSMIHHEGLDDEVKMFRRFWEKRVDNVVIRKPHTNLNSVDVGVQTVPKERWPCPHLWHRVLINHLGNIRFCPVDWYEGSHIGSLDEMTIAEAWQGPLMQDLRDRHVRGDYAGSGVCETCIDWSATYWGNGWINMIEKKEMQTA